MSFTVAQIDAQNKTFEQAYRSGKITSAQYQLAMRTQSANRAAALNREQQAQPQQPQPRAPSTEGLAPSTYWSMPTPETIGKIIPSNSTKIVPPGYDATLLPKSDYWSAPTPETIGKSVPVGGVKIVPPAGQRVVSGSIKPTATGIEYLPEPIPTKPAFVEPTLGNLLTNPAGVASTLLNLSAKVVAKDTSPLGQFVNYELGGAGQLLNWQTEAKNVINSFGKNQSGLFTPSGPLAVKNAIGDLRGNIPVMQEPLPFTPQSEAQKTGMLGARVGTAIALMVAAPAIAPSFGISSTGVVFGELVAPIVSQGFKAVQGGGLLTPEEALQSAAEGGVMSLVGMGAVKAAGSFAPKLLTPLRGSASTGAKLVGLGGRTSVNMVVDAGQAYVKSGGDPTETAKGVAFGAAFNLGFEGAGLVAPRLQAKLRESVPGMKAQDYLNQYYKINPESNARELSLGLGEKAMMKITGQKPQEPSLNIIELPKIPTAPKEAFEYSKVTEVKDVASTVYATNRQGKIVDMFDVEGPELVTSRRINEKFTPESGKITPKMQAGLVASDMLDSNTVLYGESVEPSEYYRSSSKPSDVSPISKALMDTPEIELGMVGTKVKGVPQGFDESGNFIVEGKTGSFNRSSAVDKPLSFSKQGADFGKAGLPESDSALPKYMFESDVKAKLSFNKATGPVTEFEAYSFKESSKATSKPARNGELSFSRRGMNFNEIQANIKSGRVKGVDVAADLEVAVAGKDARVQKSYGENPWMADDARALMEKNVLTQPGKGRTFTVQERSAIESLTGGQAARATGIEKILSDVQTGRAVDTSQVSVGKQTVNPFSSYAGRSYYAQKSRQTEEVEYQSLTMPGQVSRLGSGSMGAMSSADASGFMPPLTGGVAGFDVKSEPVLPSNIPVNVPGVYPDLMPIVVPEVTPGVTPSLVPDEAQKYIVVPDQVQPLIPVQEQPQTPDVIQEPWVTPKSLVPSGGKGLFGFPAGGFKFEGGSRDSGVSLRFSGVKSRRKVYPILSGADVLGLNQFKLKTAKRRRKR